MNLFLRFGFCCLLSVFLFSCKHRSKNTPLVLNNDSQIDSLIKAKEKRKYAVLTDTAKSDAPSQKISHYFSVTRFYYDKRTKELFKTENVLQASAKTIFVAYYEAGQVVKTTAQTEFGRYNDYFIAADLPDSANKKNSAGGMKESPFRQQCWLLAKEQQSIFQRKVS